MLRDNQGRSISRMRTKKIKSRSCEGKPKSVSSLDLTTLPPRNRNDVRHTGETPRDSSLTLISLHCLKFLSEKRGWETEGVFRKCGKFEDVNNALKQLSSSPNSTEMVERIFNDLGIIGVSDLLKLVLRTRDSPLLNGDCFQYLEMIPAMRFNDHMRQKDFILDTYIHASLSCLGSEQWRIFYQLCNFMEELCKYENESQQLSLSSLCKLFSVILFPTSLTLDPLSLLRESETLSSLLELIWGIIQKRKSNFFGRGRSPTPTKRFPYCSQKMGESSVELPFQVMRGEEITTFYWKEENVLLILNGTVYRANETDVAKIFVEKKGYLVEHMKRKDKFGKSHRSQRDVISLPRRLLKRNSSKHQHRSSSPTIGL